MACSFKICTKKIIANLAHRLLCFAFWNAENVHTTCLLLLFFFFFFLKISLSLAFWTWINICLREKLCLAYIWRFGYSGNEGEVCSCILLVCWCKIVLLFYWWCLFFRKHAAYLLAIMISVHFEQLDVRWYLLLNYCESSGFWSARSS